MTFKRKIAIAVLWFHVVLLELTLLVALEAERPGSIPYEGLARLLKSVMGAALQ